MFPLKTIIIGVVLIVLGGAGFVYNATRPKPSLVALQPEVLPIEEEPQPTPEPTPDNTRHDRSKRVEPEETPRQRATPTPAAPVPPKPKPLSVNLVSPVMAETFTAPATVTLKAVAGPAGEGLSKIEFYTGGAGTSVCRSLSKSEVPESFTKIGEATTAPYEFTWSNVDKGVYNITAIATYATRGQQFSPPVVIVVNAAETYDGSEWAGWRPPYTPKEMAEQNTSLMPPPTPPPSLSSCPAVTVESLSPSVSPGRPVTFRAHVTGGEPTEGLTYHWVTSAGEIAAGRETSTITVLTGGVLEKSLTATVEVGRLQGICPSTAFISVPVRHPRWLNKAASTFLRGLRRRVESLIFSLKSEPESRGYIIVHGSPGGCLDAERRLQTQLIKKYLVELQGFNSDRIVLANGGYEGPEEEDYAIWEYWIVPPGADPPAGAQTTPSGELPFVPCRENAAPEEPAGSVQVPINRTCPDIAENVSYTTTLDPGYEVEINTCPYNPKDPQNGTAQVPLRPGLRTGTFSNFPSFKYWANAGKIVGGEWNAIWDLSEVKLRPGYYTAISQADDGCDCESINTAGVKITNFCTPCLKLRRTCVQRAEESGEQTFAVDVRDFAVALPQTYHWVTSKGRISSGQGTSTATVDTSGLPQGTSFVVTVGVGGLQRYCVNQLSYQAVAGALCPPRSARFDELASMPFDPARRAKRRKPQEQEKPAPPSPPAGEQTAGNGTPETTPPTGDGQQHKPQPKEKEWMKVAWSPRVYTDDSFQIVVTYNRSTEAVEISNRAGEIIEELKLRGAIKLLKEKYGPDYKVLAAVRLNSAGLDCSNCQQEQYQSLDNEELDWSLSVSPKRAGTHTFSLEMWAKGEPRSKQSGHEPKEAEKVWSKNNLKVEVASRIVTKNTVLISSSLFVLLGVGFSLRGLRIYRIGDTYNVGQAVAVGRNVHMENTTVNQTNQKTTVQEEKGREDDG